MPKKTEPKVYKGKTVDIFHRGIPLTVHLAFKARCASLGVSMKDRLIALMKRDRLQDD